MTCRTSATSSTLDGPLYALTYVRLLFAGARWVSLDAMIKLSRRAGFLIAKPGKVPRQPITLHSLRGTRPEHQSLIDCMNSSDICGPQLEKTISMLLRTKWIPTLLLALSVLFNAAPIEVLAQGEGNNRATAVFSGGCFWGVDAVFKHVKGVSKVVSGYAGGGADTANYEAVSTGTTGHAESVQVIYDPSQVSYDDLLKVFFFVAHDPTELDRQGPDSGTQYRSSIFYANNKQKEMAEDYIVQLTQKKAFSEPIVTKVVPLTGFYPAEEYHQNYLALHPDQPYIVVNDKPKLERLREDFPGLYRQ